MKLLPNVDVREYVIPLIEDVIKCDLLGERVLPSSTDVRDAAAFLACKAHDFAPTPPAFVVQLFEMLGDQVSSDLVLYFTSFHEAESQPTQCRWFPSSTALAPPEKKVHRHVDVQNARLL